MTYAATTTTAEGTFTGTAATMPEAIRRAQYAAGTLQVWKWRWDREVSLFWKMDVADAETELCELYGIEVATQMIAGMIATGKKAITTSGWCWTCIDPTNGGVNVHRS
jgi:hypothetical protein